MVIPYLRIETHCINAVECKTLETPPPIALIMGGNIYLSFTVPFPIKILEVGVNITATVSVSSYL